MQSSLSFIVVGIAALLLVGCHQEKEPLKHASAKTAEEFIQRLTAQVLTDARKQFATKNDVQAQFTADALQKEWFYSEEFNHFYRRFVMHVTPYCHPEFCADWQRQDLKNLFALGFRLYLSSIDNDSFGILPHFLEWRVDTEFVPRVSGRVRLLGAWAYESGTNWTYPFRITVEKTTAGWRWIPEPDYRERILEFEYQPTNGKWHWTRPNSR